MKIFLAKKHILNLALFCSFSILILAVFGCNKENKKAAVVATGMKSAEIPDQQIWDMKILQTDSENVTYRIYAGYVKSNNPDFSQTGVNDIDSGFTMISYKNGKLYGRLDSRRGVRDDYRNIYIAIDSVVLKSPAGYTVYTQRLTWNKNEKRFFSETPVMSVNSKNDTLWGDGFVSTQDFKEYNIANPRGKAFMADSKLNKP